MKLWHVWLLVTIALAGCATSPIAVALPNHTPIPPTATLPQPSSTLALAPSTSLPPTIKPSPTATSLPPTQTPTSIPQSPTDTATPTITPMPVPPTPLPPSPTPAPATHSVCASGCDFDTIQAAINDAETPQS